MLWKQILGLTLFTIILQLPQFYHRSFSILDILWVLMGVFTFCDAWSSGIYKKKGIKSLRSFEFQMESFINLSPMGWGIAMQFLTIITYPLYLVNRNKLKTKPNNNIFFIFTIITGILALGPFVLAIVMPNILRAMGK